MRTLILLSVVAVALAQYDAGFVKILQDKRYQSGSTFGNFRDQEDGTKYFEETDELGVRRGYWEYVDQEGKTIRNEFEAGPGIGFRIIKSNIHDATPSYKPLPQYQAPQPVRTAAPQYQPVQPQYQPVPIQPVQPVQPQYQPAPVHVPAPRPTPAARFTPTLQPEPQNLFDYPGNLEFSRSHQGHRFKFVAT